MRKLNDDYLPLSKSEKPTTSTTRGWIPMSEHIASHYRPIDTGKRLDQLIAYFSQLQGEQVDAEWVVKFCIDQIHKDTHTPAFNTGRCRVFTRI